MLWPGAPPTIRFIPKTLPLSSPDPVLAAVAEKNSGYWAVFRKPKCGDAPMSETPHFFQKEGRKISVILPFQLEEVLASWEALRLTMIRKLPDDFTRDEWAYLISF